jgi:hypothetical protein
MVRICSTETAGRPWVASNWLTAVPISGALSISVPSRSKMTVRICGMSVFSL